MISKTENSIQLDIMKWVAISLLLLAGIIANIHFSNIAMPVRLLGWLFLIFIVFGIAFKTRLGFKAWGFTQEARTEIRKVVWPTRQETTHTTIIVIVMVVVAGLFLWGIDSLFLWLISMLTGQRG